MHLSRRRVDQEQLTVPCIQSRLSPTSFQEAPDSGQGRWFGEGALSFTSYSGNTDSKNLNANLNINRETPVWNHKAALESLKSETDGDTSADSLIFTHRSEYTISKKSYAFGQLRSENDEFGGFSYQTSLTIGFGTRLTSNPKHSLDISFGTGYRKSKNSDTDKTTKEAILSSTVNYEYKISETTALIETFLIETGEDNTYTESRTSLRTRINDKLATRMSYLIKHNSEVPSDADSTDEIVSISLVYSF